MVSGAGVRFRKAARRSPDTRRRRLTGFGRPVTVSSCMKYEPHQRGWRRRGEVFVPVLGALLAGAAVLSGAIAQESAEDDAPATAAEPAADQPAANEWTGADTKLANHYIRLLQEKPEYGNVLDLLWALYEKRGQTDLLLKYFQQAAGNGPPVATILYGHLLRKNEEPDAAGEIYRKVLETEPGNLVALKGAAEIADQQRSTEEAILLYEKLGPLVPIQSEEGVAIRQRHASLLRESGRTDEAVAIWDALLVAWPGNDFLRTEIVGHLMEAGRSEEAIKILRELKQRGDPELRLTSLEILDQLYEFTNDFDGAADALTEAMDLVHFKHQRHTVLFERYVRLHERFSRLPELEQRLREPASRPQPSEKAVFLMAEFYELTADPVNEEKWVERLTGILPNDVEYKVRLVEIRMQNDRYAEAAGLLDSLIASQPDRPLRLVLLRCRLALHLDGREKAETMLREELERRGTPEIDVERKVLTFARENYLDGIVEELLRRPNASEIAGGGNTSAPVDLAKFLRERGRTEQAEKALRDYVDEAGASPTLRAARLSEVSAVFLDLDLPEEAAKCLDEAIGLAPDQLPYRIAKADLLIESKHTGEAIRQLEKVWALAPDVKARTEIDQQLFSLLRGLADRPAPSEPVITAPPAGMPQGAPIQTLEEYRRLAAQVSLANRNAEDPPPERLTKYYHDIKGRAEADPSLANRYRAAWWAFKMQDTPEAVHQLTQAQTEAGDTPVIEVEKMLLEVFEQKGERGDLFFMARQLDTLARIDPQNAAQYRHRWAEVRFLLGYEDEAVRTLEELARDPNVSLNTLKTLASVYQKQGRVTAQVEVWQDAYRRANLFEKRRIIKQLSTTLIELGQPEGALKAQLDLIRRETDPVQKRKQFDAQLSVANRHYLLTWLRDRYLDLAQQKPFDRFYPEALARIHEAAGDDEAAFLAMKRAYYMSGHDRALLAELGEMAGRSKDLKSAIYYHRQLIAQDEAGASAESWESLIEMLERDLRVPEADLIRRRLEGKFAQDADFLKTLAQNYRLWGEFAAAERVTAKLTVLRPWDAKAWLELGLLQKHRGDAAAALASFEKAIAQTRDAAFPVDQKRMLHPPLVRGGWDPGAADRAAGTGPEALADGVQDYPFLVAEVQDQIVNFLRSARPEFDWAPGKKWAVRLRAIEEAGRLAGLSEPGREPWRRRWSDPEKASPTERFWALSAAGDKEAAYRILAAHWPRQTPVDKFVFALLGLRLDRGTEVADWAEESFGPGEGAGAEGDLDRRVYPLVAGLQLMRGGSDFEMAPETIRAVFSRLSITRALAWHLFDRVRAEGRPQTAMELGLALAGQTLANDGDFLFAVSQVAARLGRNEERRQWLDRSLSEMEPDGFRGLPKSWVPAISEAIYECESANDQQALVRDLVARVDSHPAAGEMVKQENRAFLALITGDADTAVASIRSIVSRLLAAGRPDQRSVDGETFPGIQLWSLMERCLHEFASRRPPALAPERLYDALGGEPLSEPREEGALGQFEQFEMMRLTWLLEDLTPPERHRHLQSFFSRLRDPSSRVELARTLDARGFDREAIAVYRACVAENPDDLSPLRGFFGACQQARDFQPALLLIQACLDGQQRVPAGMMEEYLVRNHAEFLLMARDLETLSALAQGAPAEEKKSDGKTPPNAPLFGNRSGPLRALYQDALVRAHEATGNTISMLRVLEHMRDQGNVTKENRLRAARALIGEGRKEEAIAWLEGVKLDQQQSLTEIDAIRDLGNLYAGRDNVVRADLVRLVNAAMQYGNSKLLRDLTGLLYDKGARTEARSCLLEQARKDRATRGANLSTLARLELEHGAGFESVADTLRNLMEDLPDDPAVVREMVELAGEFGKRDADGWKSFLEEFRDLPRVRVVAEVGLAGLTGDWRACGAASPDWADSLSPDEISLFLELASGQGEAGIEAARGFLRGRNLPSTQLFDGNPLRQVAFLGRIGDSVRAAELRTRLLSETVADGFYQNGAKEVAPAFEERWPVAAAFAEAGFRDLAGALFRRYQEGIPRVTWEHVEFLESYAHFLIKEGEFARAEEILRPAFQKSLGADPEVLVELYGAWGRLGDLESLVRKWFLPSGVVLRVAEIRAEWERNAVAAQ